MSRNLRRRFPVLGMVLVAAGLAALTGIGGCDDDPAGPGDGLPFSFELTVQTAIGAPVRGLEIALNVPLLGAGLDRAAKAATVAHFCASDLLDADLEVYDLDGDLVRTLMKDYPAQPGIHAVVFDGRDDLGEPILGTAVLDIRLELRSPLDGSLVATDSFRSVLYTGLDAEQRPVLGTTDFQGRIVTTQRRLFPFLYDLGDLIRYDESAESLGTFMISDTVEIFINDPIAHLQAMARFRITDGPNAFTMTWPPGAEAIVAAGPAHGTGSEAGAEAGPAAEPATEADIEPVVGCEPDMIVFPNPFN